MKFWEIAKGIDENIYSKDDSFEFGSGTVFINENSILVYDDGSTVDTGADTEFKYIGKRIYMSDVFYVPKDSFTDIESYCNINNEKENYLCESYLNDLYIIPIDRLPSWFVKLVSQEDGDLGAFHYCVENRWVTEEVIEAFVQIVPKLHKAFKYPENLEQALYFKGFTLSTYDDGSFIQYSTLDYDMVQKIYGSDIESSFITLSVSQDMSSFSVYLENEMDNMTDLSLDEFLVYLDRV